MSSSPRRPAKRLSQPPHRPKSAHVTDQPSQSGAAPSHSPTLSVAQAVPTLGRRLLAWSLEVAVLTASVAGPFYLGGQLNQRAESPEADLAPILQTVQTQGAKLLGVSPRSLPEKVTPLTNLLWSASMGLPLILAAAHIYSVGRYGRSWPKQWVGVQVLSLKGQMPGWGRALIREGVGKWGSSCVVAYGVWQISGAFPVLGVLAGLGAIALIGESLTGLSNRPRRTWHDWLAGTCVVDQETGAIIHLSSLWDAEAQIPQGWGRVSDWMQAVGPTSVVIDPNGKHWYNTDLTFSKVGIGLGALLTLGGLVGVGSYFLLGQASVSATGQDEMLYTDLVTTLTNPELDPAARRSAVLALGNLPDERVTPLLVDLIAQTEDPLWLDALQQALIARGEAAFPPLRRLNQGLSADLAMQDGPTPNRTTLIRLQTVNRILTKLLLLEGDDRTFPLDLSRMHLGHMGVGDREFRLVLQNRDLAGILWQGSVLNQAQFQGARFYSPGPDNHRDTYDDRTTDFSGADLSDANLTGADLTLSQLVNAGLLRTNLNRADLTLANLSGANLESASLIQTVLDQATLNNARLSQADLTEAQLTQANLQGARLAELSAAGARLIEGNLQDVTATAANLSHADLSQADLANADLTNADLQDANLRGANLSATNLQDADLRGVELQGAVLEDANFAGAILTMPSSRVDGGFVESVPELTPGNQFDGVDFNRSQNLDSEQLNFICAQGGLHSACSPPQQN